MRTGELQGLLDGQHGLVVVQLFDVARHVPDHELSAADGVAVVRDRARDADAALARFRQLACKVVAS